MRYAAGGNFVVKVEITSVIPRPPAISVVTLGSTKEVCTLATRAVPTALIAGSNADVSSSSETAWPGALGCNLGTPPTAENFAFNGGVTHLVHFNPKT